MVNKAYLSDILMKSAGLSRAGASKCVDAMLDAVAQGISKGKGVELRGLGTFFVRKTAARKTALNGPGAVVPEHGRIIFRPCRNLRESVWNKTV